MQEPEVPITQNQPFSNHTLNKRGHGEGVNTTPRSCTQMCDFDLSSTSGSSGTLVLSQRVCLSVNYGGGACQLWLRGGSRRERESWWHTAGPQSPRAPVS